MIAMKISWLALELMLAGCFLHFGSSGALALAVLLVLLPLAGLGVNLYLRKRVRINVTAPVNARKGEGAAFHVELENPTPFPALRVRCVIRVENQLNRERKSFSAGTWLPARRGQRVTLTTGSGYCGRLRITVERTVLYDCFGLIGVHCPCDAAAHLTVMPDTFEPEITLLPVPRSGADSDLYAQDRPGADMTETYQIREYVPGDSPRQIHWKLSGKFDKLIVRDPAMPITADVLVFWERTGESGDPESIDAQAETVVSLCRSLLDSGIRFCVGWNDTDRNLCILHRIGDMDALVGIIPRLMRATGTAEGISGAGLLLQTGPEAMCAHMVYLAEEPQSEVMELERFGHVTMLLCGKTPVPGAVMFDPAGYREQLTQIEL